MRVLYNGEIVEKSSIVIDIEDRGYQFGDGIYEVVPIYASQLFEWDAHYERFERSAKEISLSLPTGIEKLKQNIEQLIEEQAIEDGFVYFQLTRGVSPRAHFFPEPAVPPILTGQVKARPAGFTLAPIKAITQPDIRWLRVDIKSLNLLGNCLVKQAAVEAGAQEAILVRDGFVTEASSSNVFGVKNGKLYTHPINHLILNGISRQVVVRIAAKLGIELNETAMTSAELLEMDEVFITNSGINVCPVYEIDGKIIGSGDTGVITAQIMQQFDKLLPKKITL